MSPKPPNLGSDLSGTQSTVARVRFQPVLRLKWYGFKGFPSHSSHCSGGLFPQYSGVSPKSVLFRKYRKCIQEICGGLGVMVRILVLFPCQDPGPLDLGLRWRLNAAIYKTPAFEI